MGLKDLFRRKHKNVEETEDFGYKGMKVDAAILFTQGKGGHDIPTESVTKVVSELCENIISFREQLVSTQAEYDIVTQYLSDIAKIENLNEKSRGTAMDEARLMITLDDERVRFQNAEKTITYDQHRCMSMYEDEMPEIIKDMEDKEHYMEMIREDLHHLEGERGVIRYDTEKVLLKKAFMKKCSYIVLIAGGLIFLALIAVMMNTGKDLMLPFFVTGLGVMAFAAYYTITTRECSTEIKRLDYRMNKAVQLINKVKIKQVNTTNALDYAYEKYQVNSKYELERIWNEYIKAKDDEARYRKNTQLITSYRKELEALLAKEGIVRVDTWSAQPEVFIDRGELYDFKDGIERRRKKLRAQIDFNIRQQDNSLHDINALVSKYPRFTELARQIREKYGV